MNIYGVSKILTKKSVSAEILHQVFTRQITRIIVSPCKNDIVRLNGSVLGENVVKSFYSIITVSWRLFRFNLSPNF